MAVDFRGDPLFYAGLWVKLETLFGPGNVGDDALSRAAAWPIFRLQRAFHQALDKRGHRTR